MAAWIVLALWMSGNSSSAQPTAFNHLRSGESFVRDVIGEGYARSVTFRRLVDTTEGLPCIVYVATAVKLPAGMTGALLHMPAGLREMPVLRVLLKSNLSRQEAIAMIAHELQHVVEAASAARTTGRWDMAAAFDQLDPATARTTGVHRYETDAAVEIWRTVRDELRRGDSRPKR